MFIYYILLIFYISIYANNCGECIFINILINYTKDKTIDKNLLESLTKQQEFNRTVFDNSTAILFSYFPELKNSLPYISLGNFPTPVEKLEKIGAELGIAHLYIKRDDLSGKKYSNGTQLFGGNKVRKLEFFLADAIYNGAQSVMTFGGVGSNHCVATAVYARQLGLRSICLLKNQPNSLCVQRNLLLMHSYGATMHWFPSMQERNKNAATIFLSHKKQYGDFPCVIPPGASLPIGTIGYVNAALELKEQINQGLMPTPDYIYLAVGSMGTTAGLLLGLKVAQLSTKVIAINTDPDEKNSDFVEGITRLFYETNTLLHSKDNNFPLVELAPDEICVLHSFCGTEYGEFTQEGKNYIKTMYEKENILLDGTYTSKAFAGLVADVYQRNTKKDIILFWNTWCSDSFENVINLAHYKKLPQDFQRYFESPTQDEHLLN